MIDVVIPPAYLDQSVLADIRGLNTPDEDVLGEVISLYVDDVPKQLSALAAAIGAGQTEVVRQIAHRLKGSSLGVGASRMASLCSAIECAAHDHAIDHAAVHAEGLAAEFVVTSRALEQEKRAS
ncbi:MAG: Hpt domain-containing protein [Acidobacteriota bacterium]